MAWSVLLLVAAVTPCDPWLVEQVERARARTSAEPLELDCPAPSVVNVSVEWGEGDSRQVRLSGFSPADAWVGAALVALVELRRAELAAAPRGPVRPTVEPQEEVSLERAEEVRPTGPRLSLRPSLLFVGEELQLAIGGEVVLGIGPVNLGLGASRHGAESALGSLSGTDLLVVATLPLEFGQWSAARLSLEPGVGLGACRLEGTALSDATPHSAWRATLRGWLDLGLAFGPQPSGFNLVTGIRAGFRLAPAGQVDGQTLLVGSGPLLGAYLGVGWSP